MKRLIALLRHPLTKDLGLDDARTTLLRQQIVREKRFLAQLYREWNATLGAAIPAGPGRVLELGSGGDVLREFIPDLVTSNILALPQLDLQTLGESLPFADESLKAIVMTNVFHHISDVRAMLHEAARVTRPGGRMAMIEPWNTAWSRVVYRHLHHEPFEPATLDWALPAGGGPLSSANGALPWIVFARDRARFAEEFPEWTISSITPFMPLAYVLSGGVASRVGAPGGAYGFVRRMEQRLPQGLCAMFATIVLDRNACRT